MTVEPLASFSCWNESISLPIFKTFTLTDSESHMFKTIWAQHRFISRRITGFDLYMAVASWQWPTDARIIFFAGLTLLLENIWLICASFTKQAFYCIESINKIAVHNNLNNFSTYSHRHNRKNNFLIKTWQIEVS